MAKKWPIPYSDANTTTTESTVAKLLFNFSLISKKLANGSIKKANNKENKSGDNRLLPRIAK